MCRRLNILSVQQARLAVVTFTPHLQPRSMVIVTAYPLAAYRRWFSRFWSRRRGEKNASRLSLTQKQLSLTHFSSLLDCTHNKIPYTPPSTMTTLREFRLDDLLRFNNINFDVLTETYNGTIDVRWNARWDWRKHCACFFGAKLVSSAVGTFIS